MLIVFNLDLLFFYYNNFFVLLKFTPSMFEVFNHIIFNSFRFRITQEKRNYNFCDLSYSVETYLIYIFKYKLNEVVSFIKFINQIPITYIHDFYNYGES